MIKKDLVEEIFTFKPLFSLIISHFLLRIYQICSFLEKMRLILIN